MLDSVLQHGFAFTARLCCTNSFITYAMTYWNCELLNWYHSLFFNLLKSSASFPDPFSYCCAFLPLISSPLVAILFWLFSLLVMFLLLLFYSESGMNWGSVSISLVHSRKYYGFKVTMKSIRKHVILISFRHIILLHAKLIQEHDTYKFSI